MAFRELWLFGSLLCEVRLALGVGREMLFFFYFGSPWLCVLAPLSLTHYLCIFVSPSGKKDGAMGKIEAAVPFPFIPDRPATLVISR